FQDVPAEARLERFRHDAWLDIVRDLLELRHERAGAAPAHVAATVGGAGIVGQQFRQLSEFLACLDLLARFFEPLLRRLVVDDLVRRDQYVPDLHLLDFASLVDPANLVDLDNVIAADRADGLRVISGFHVAYDIREEGGQLVTLAPSEIAAFQARFAVGVADRQFTEILSLFELLVDETRFGLGLLELLVRCRLGHGDQYV